MSEFHAILGGDEENIEYYSIWEQKVTLIEEILYDQDSKSYFDFNLETGELNENTMEHNSMQNNSYSIFQFPNSNQNMILSLHHIKSLQLMQLSADELSGIQSFF